LEFQPRTCLLPDTRIYRQKWWHIRRLGTHEAGLRGSEVYEYASLVRKSLASPLPEYPRIPGVCPGFDNSPRKERDGVILINSTPELYGSWLSAVVDRVRAKKAAEDSAEALLFINAWNEWGEGNHLEPCQRWGRKYLEATRSALEVPARQSIAYAQS
jgi:hypothetical protein